MLKEFFSNPELFKFFLIVARLSGLVIFAPPFMNPKVSVQLKASLVFFLSVAVFPSVHHVPAVFPELYPEMGLVLAHELLVGFIIGFGVRLMFTTFQLAGEFIDKHIGFAMASLVDPQTDVTVSILGSLLMNLALFVFIDFGGHLWVIKSFAGSFHSIPLLAGNFHMDGILYHISELFFRSIIFAAEFSFPVIATVSLVYIAQGFLQRTIPQFQIFVVGFIFTITVGLSSVKLTLKHFAPASEGIMEFFQERIWFVITHLNHGG
ncbi:MAG: flagellar biosynthetic protein FliR [Planctomycetes bacterium]|nr:flagellar biosynthetic protein FliR [Planctomycetota bacterium]